MTGVHMRVSSNSQSATSQRRELERYLAAQGIEDPRWFVDEGIPPPPVESSSGVDGELLAQSGPSRRPQDTASRGSREVFTDRAFGKELPPQWPAPGLCGFLGQNWARGLTVTIVA